MFHILRLVFLPLAFAVRVVFWTAAVAVPGVARAVVRLLGFVLVLPHFRSWPR